MGRAKRVEYLPRLSSSNQYRTKVKTEAGSVNARRMNRFKNCTLFIGFPINAIWKAYLGSVSIHRDVSVRPISLTNAHS